MKVQRAKGTAHVAKLSSEFGEAMAKRWFTAEQLANWPKLKTGKNKGKLSGVISWTKIEEGGWSRSMRNGIGGVIRPGTRNVRLVRTDNNFNPLLDRRELESSGRVGVAPAETATTQVQPAT